MSDQSRPIRVVCVDDNEFIAAALARMLRRARDLEWAGWVEHAERARAAVEALRPDVVLMDIDMPGPDAFEVVAELAAAFPKLRIMMLSGHIRRDMADRAFRAGAWGYVSKDTEPDMILESIRKVARGEVVIQPGLDDGRGNA